MCTSSNNICSTKLWGSRRWIIFAIDKAPGDFIWRCVEGIFGEKCRRKHSLDWMASWEHFAGRFAHKKTVWRGTQVRDGMWVWTGASVGGDPGERWDVSVNRCIRGRGPRWETGCECEHVHPWEGTRVRDGMWVWTHASVCTCMCCGVWWQPGRQNRQ